MEAKKLVRDMESANKKEISLDAVVNLVSPAMASSSVVNVKIP